MRLKIVQAGDPVLRQATRQLTPTEISSPDIQRLIQDMRETMYDAPGVGLAAPQVGIPIQLAVLEDRPESSRDLTPEQLAERERRPTPFQVLINPTIVSQSQESVDFFEGCLSVAGFAALVRRARSVRIEHLDENGAARALEAHGWHARVLQHEIDHLQGTLYVDRMNPRTLTSLENFARHWKSLPTSQVLTKVGS